METYFKQAKYSTSKACNTLQITERVDRGWWIVPY